MKTNVVENPSSSSIAAEVRPTIPTNTQKRKAHTNSTKQTSITEYLDKNEEEFEDDDDGWTTEYEPMKPLSSPPAKRTTTTTVRGKSNGNNTKRKLNTSAKANAEENVPFVLEFDGASRGNPGPAGAGALIRAPRIPSDAREEEGEEKERCGEIIKEI